MVYTIERRDSKRITKTHTGWRYQWMEVLRLQFLPKRFLFFLLCFGSLTSETCFLDARASQIISILMTARGKGKKNSREKMPILSRRQVRKKMPKCALCAVTFLLPSPSLIEIGDDEINTEKRHHASHSRAHFLWNNSRRKKNTTTLERFSSSLFFSLFRFFPRLSKTRKLKMY